jgi:hypothetical protein
MRAQRKKFFVKVVVALALLASFILINNQRNAGKWAGKWAGKTAVAKRGAVLFPPWGGTAEQRLQLWQFFKRINPGVNWADPESTQGGALCEEIIYTGDWPMCGDALTDRSGLVYAFGIEKNWDFEASAGAQGFEVLEARYKEECMPVG